MGGIVAAPFVLKGETKKEQLWKDTPPVYSRVMNFGEFGTWDGVRLLETPETKYPTVFWQACDKLHDKLIQLRKDGYKLDRMKPFNYGEKMGLLFVKDNHYKGLNVHVKVFNFMGNKSLGSPIKQNIKN